MDQERIEQEEQLPVEEGAPVDEQPIETLTLPTKKQWRQRNAKMYAIVTFLYGVVCSTLPIIITELIWDAVVKRIGVDKNTLGYNIFADFFRAALIEETFKFVGLIGAYRHFKFKRQIEAMWAAAIVGMVYGLVEKAVLFNVIPVILGVFLPMHTLWQLNRGRQLFAFFEAKKAGDKRRAFKEMFLATFVIFLMHGCWDAVLDVIEYFANNKELQYGDVISVVGMIVLVSLGVVYAVFTVITTVKVAQRDRQALRFAEEADL